MKASLKAVVLRQLRRSTSAAFIAGAPVNTVAPAVSGTTTEGSTLSTTDGTWTGTPTISFTYQWFDALLDGSGNVLTDSNGDPLGSPVSSATANTYVLPVGSSGKRFFCTVTATNGLGGAWKDSNVTVAITAGGSATTWNPADKGTNVDLDVTKLIATGGASAGGAAAARATQGESSGKWYWEVILNVNNAGTGLLCAGLEISTASLSNFVGFNTNSIALLNGDQVWKNGSAAGSVGSWDVATPNASFAWDADNKKLWVRVQGGQWNGNSASNDPATNTGGFDLSTFGAGTYMPAISLDVPGDQMTGKFSSSSWTYTAPSGFSQLP